MNSLSASLKESSLLLEFSSESSAALPVGTRPAPRRFFHDAHVGGKGNEDNKAYALKRNEFLPQNVDVSIEDNARTSDRTAPRKQVHDRHGGTDNADEHNGAHVKFLVDRQHSRDGDEQRGSKGAVKVGDNSDEARCNRNHDDVGSPLS